MPPGDVRRAAFRMPGPGRARGDLRSASAARRRSGCTRPTRAHQLPV